MADKIHDNIMALIGTVLKGDASKVDWKTCRSRIEHEDTLMNARTGVFLTINSIAAIAARGADNYDVLPIIAPIMTIICLFWFLCSIQTWLVIRNLTIFYTDEKKGAKDIIDKIARLGTTSNRYLHATPILGIYLPCTVCIGWIVALMAYFWK